MRIRSVAMLLAVLVSSQVAAGAASQANESRRAIVGGREATEPYRFMVSVQKGGNHFCGGSLVRKAWVLTAAHCVDSDEPDAIQVRMGSHQPTDGPIFLVTQIVVHERWEDLEAYDVALLRLDRNAPYQTIKLAGKKQAGLWEPGDIARVIGWGTNRFLVGSRASTLQEVDVPIVADDDCAQVYLQYEEETEMCAGEEDGGKDSCHGDSGGPLMVKSPKSERWYQVGTVSWGLGCGFPLFYGVYGKVAANPLRSWILSHTR